MKRIVIDTNVLVAALLHPGRTPDVSLSRVLDGTFTVLVDQRVEDEYREVLARRKFKAIPENLRDALIARVLSDAERVAATPYEGELTDDDDRAFIEVCLSGHADVLLTGNGKHFPRDLGFVVASPAEMLAMLTAP